MKLSDYLSIFTSDEFYLVKKDNIIYAISNYRLGDEEFDYGIYGTINRKDLENGSYVDTGIVPDIFVDAFFTDMQDYVLCEECNIPKDIIHQIASSPYSDWYDELIKLGYNTDNLSKALKPYCDIYKGVSFEAETVDLDYNQCDSTTKECIDLYNELYL